MSAIPIRADCLKNAKGHVFIKFFDPAYVRSDSILFDPADRSLYAVLHENAHFIGRLDDDMAELFSKNEEVHLTAAHYTGGSVNLRAPLVVTEA